MHMRNHLQKFKEEEKAVRLWLWRKRHFEKAKIIQQLRIKIIHSLKVGCVIFTCFWSGFFQILYQCLISLISPLDEPARVLCQDLLLVPKLIWQIDNLLLCFINMLLLYAKTFYANWFKTAGFNVKKKSSVFVFAWQSVRVCRQIGLIVFHDQLIGCLLTIQKVKVSASTPKSNHFSHFIHIYFIFSPGRLCCCGTRSEPQNTAGGNMLSELRGARVSLMDAWQV